MLLGVDDKYVSFLGLQDYDSKSVYEKNKLIRENILKFHLLDENEKSEAFKNFMKLIGKKNVIPSKDKSYLINSLLNAFIFYYPDSTQSFKFKLTNVEDNIFLFSSILTLSVFQKITLFGGDVLKYFKEGLDKIARKGPDGKESSFYTRNFSFFALKILDCLEGVDVRMSDEIVRSFFDSVERISESNVNFNDMLFLSRSFFPIGRYALSDEKLSEEFVSVFEKFLEKCWSFCPHVFSFLLWSCYSLHSRFKKQNLLTLYSNSLIVYCFKVTTSKIHEFHLTFQWKLILKIFDTTKSKPNSSFGFKSAVFIFHGLNTVFQIEKAVTFGLLENFISSIHESASSLSFMLASNIDSILRKLTHSIDKIEGISFEPSFLDEGKVSIDVSFQDQCFDNPPIQEFDLKLRTSFRLRRVVTIGEADSIYVKQIHIFNKVRKQMTTFLPFVSNIGYITASSNKRDSFYYIIRYAGTLTKLIIKFTYKQAALQLYQRRHRLLNSDNPHESKSSRSLVLDIPQFYTVFDAFTRIVREIPEERVKTVAAVISKYIISYIRKKMITVNFCQFLELLECDKVFPFIIRYICTNLESNIPLLFSNNSEDVEFLFNSLLLVNRWSMRCGFLEGVKKIIIETGSAIVKAALSRCKDISHLNIVFELIHVNPDMVNLSLRDLKMLLMDHQPGVLSVESLKVIIEFLTHLRKDLKLSFSTRLFIKCLKTNNRELINKTVSLVVFLFVREYDEKEIDFNNIDLGNLIYSMFSLRHYFDDETSKLAVAIWDKCGQFLANKHSRAIYKCGLMIEDLSIDMYIYLRGIMDNFVASDYHSLFFIVSNCFKTIFQNPCGLKNQFDLYSVLFSFLSECYANQKLRKDINVLGNHISELFSSQIYNSESYEGFLAIVSEASKTRTISSCFLLNLADEVLRKVYVRTGPNHKYIDFIADRIVTQFCVYNTGILLLSFHLLSKYYLPHISPIHLSAILTTQFTSSVTLLDYQRLFEQLLKDYFYACNPEQKKEFIDILYRSVGLPKTSCRQVILDMLLEIKAKVPPVKTPDLSSPITVHTISSLQKIVTSCACGEPIKTDQFNAFLSFFQMRPDQTIPEISYRYTFILNSLIRAPNILEFLSNKKIVSCIKNILSIAQKTLYSSIMKSFKYLISNSPQNHQFINEMKSSISGSLLFGREDSSNSDGRFRVYRRLTKFFPDSFESSHLDDLVRYFHDVYLALPQKDKKDTILFPIHFLKLLSNDNILSRRDVQYYLDERFPDLFSYFMDVKDNISIPYDVFFMKHLSKFLACFSKYNKNVFLKPFTEERHERYQIFDVLYEAIIEDKSYTLLNNILDSSDVLKENGVYILHFIDILSRIPNSFYKTMESNHNHESLILVCKKLHSFAKGLYDDYKRLYDSQSQSDHMFILTERIFLCLVGLFRIIPNVDDAFELSHVFEYPLFIHSIVYKKFNKYIFSASQKICNDIIDIIMNNIANLTSKQVSIMLPNAAVKCNISYFGDRFWKFLLEHARCSPNYGSGMIKTIYFCIKKNVVPSKNTMERICNVLPIYFVSSSIEGVYYSLKLSRELQKRDLLPSVLVRKVFKLAFSYIKFFENPYKLVVLEILSDGKDQILEHFEKIQDVLVYCVKSHMPDPKLISRLINIFYELSYLVSYLPIPILTGFVNVLDHLHSVESTKPENVNDLDDLYFKVWSMFRATKFDSNDIAIANNSARKFLNVILGRMNKSKFAQEYFDFIVDHTAFFPYDLIDLIDESNFSIASMSFISSLAKVQPSKLDEYQRLVILGIKFFQVDDGSSQSYIKINLRPFFDYVLSKSDIYMTHLKETLNFIKISDDWHDKIILTYWTYIKMLQTRERSTFIGNNIIHLKLAVDTNYFSHLYGDIFRLLISSVETLCESEQQPFLQYLLNLDLPRQDIVYIFQITPYLLSSKKIAIESKYYILSGIQIRIDTDVIQYIPNIINQTKLIEDQKIRTLMVDILIFSISVSKGIQLLKLYNILYTLLPTGFCDRYEFVFTQLTPELFSYFYLPYVVSLLVTNPIFACSIAIMKPGDLALQEIIRNKTIQYIKQTGKKEPIIKLLTIISSIKSKRYYNTILESIYYVIISEKIEVERSIMVKLHKRVGHPMFNEVLSKFIEPDVKFVNITEPNDSIFLQYRSKLSKCESVALLLCNANLYKPAIELLRSQESLNGISEIYLTIAEHYSNSQEKSIDSILKVFSNPYSQFDKMSSYCSSVADSIQTGQKKGLSEDFGVSLVMFDSGFKQLVFEKILCFKLLDNIASTSIVSPFVINRAQLMVNPYRLESIERIMRIIDGNSLERTYDAEAEAIFFVSPKQEHYFDHIVGYTTSGLVGIPEESLKTLINRLQGEKNLTANEWASLAPVFFHLYCLQQSDDVFNVVFKAYSFLIESRNDLTPIKVHESFARLTTLMKLAKNHHQLSDSFILNVKNMFKKEFSDHWVQFYPHILEAIDNLSLVDDFFQRTSHYILHTLIFSRNIPSIREKIASTTEGTDSLHIIRASNDFFDAFFEMDHDLLNRMVNIINFIQTFARSSPSNLRPIEEILSSKPINAVEFAIHNLDYRDLGILDHLGEIQKDSSINTCLKYANSITDSQVDIFASFNEKRLKFIKCYDYLLTQNNHMLLYNSFAKFINADTIIMSPLSQFGSHVSLVQRVNIDDDINSKYLLSNLVSLISDNFYGTMSRYIPSYRHSPTFLSEKYVLSRFDEAPLTLNNIIEKSTFKAPRKDTPPDSFKKYMAANYDVVDYISIRYNFICDISRNAIQRILMNTPYPSLTSWIFVPNRGFVPFLLSQDVYVKGSSNFRLSPNIATFIGDKCKDAILPPFIVVANSIVANYDLSLSVLEVSALNCLSSIEQVVKKRDQIFDMIQSLSPPSRVSTPQDFYSDWFDNVEKTIMDAMDASIQPTDAFPWI